VLFSSISFLYYFLTIVLAVYFIVPFKFKNLVLLISSLIFYFYGEPVYTLLMLATIISSYIHGLLIDRFRGGPLSKVFLCSSVVISLAVLGFFKYSDFFIHNFNNIFNTGFELLGIALPIGISFFTFQTMSYTIDVYRGDAAVQKNFIHLATYVALFPQLIAGPIVRYVTIEEDLCRRTHSFENFAYGINRFILGLAKKVLIADTLSLLAKSLHTTEHASVLGYWVYAVAISLQLYFDFSGYSDMAIGLGRIFGFRFLENFNYPFISKSISEFWRRWHISLGTWFRDYLYIPMGGNRVALPRWVFNTFTVWLLTGFWHGADWTFILWGVYFALFLILEKFFLNKAFSKLPPLVSRIISHVYVCVVILVSFVLFNGAGLQGSLKDIGAMFGAGALPLVNNHTLYYLSGYTVVLAVAVISATPIPKNLVLKAKENLAVNKAFIVIEPLVHLFLLLVITAYFVDGSFSPFLYFRF